VVIKVLHNADRLSKVLYLMNPETSPSLFANGFLACAIKTCFSFRPHIQCTTKVYNLITLCYALHEQSTERKAKLIMIAGN
jgi:hypothetical protein